MPYIKRYLSNVKNVKAYEILINHGYTMNQAQRLIDKNRLYCDDNLISKKNMLVNGKVYLIDYECRPEGLKPIFETEDFAVFDKPSGVLSHPNGRNCIYSMNDEIWHLYGKEAGVAHRLDKETSGVLIVAKNINSQNKLKNSFERQEITKIYYALVYGKVTENFIVDKAIGSAYEDNEVKIRMQIRSDGKRAQTEFYPVKYFEDFNTSLIKIKPLTGRQHQIRLHLFHVKHKIMGEPLYGLQTNIVEDIMDNKICVKDRIKFTGAARLCLHASEISLKFDNNIYCIKTKMDFEADFLNSISKS